MAGERFFVDPEGHKASLARAEQAQNLDVESFRNGLQVVLRIVPEGGAPEQRVFSSAGVIG